MKQKPEVARFAKFIREIIADGQWEYGNGQSMTKDARAFYEAWKQAVAKQEAAK